LEPEISAVEQLSAAVEHICATHHVTPATIADAEALAPIMRLADCEEVWAAAGLDPLDGLRVSLASSVSAWCWRIDGQPACLFGVSAESILSGTGIPWLLSSHLLPRQQLAFLRYGRVFINTMLMLFPCLCNWVDARYLVSVKWLRWLGFTVFPAEPYGPFGMPFHRFELTRSSCHP